MTIILPKGRHVMYRIDLVLTCQTKNYSCMRFKYYSPAKVDFYHQINIVLGKIKTEVKYVCKTIPPQ